MYNIQYTCTTKLDKDQQLNVKQYIPLHVHYISVNPRHSHINKGIKRNLNKYILKPIKNVLISLQQLKVKRPMILVNKIRKNLTKSAIIQ